jgi:hypothetical protein
LRAFAFSCFSFSGFAFFLGKPFLDKPSRPEGRVLVRLGAEESPQDLQAKLPFKVSRRDF